MRAAASVLILASLAALGIAGCSSGKSAEAAGAPADSSTLLLPPGQREKLEMQAVAPVAFKPTVQTTGTVAFDGDQSTPVLAPMSGPVSRVLVQTGAQVHAGEILAYVSSPDFAAAVAAYRKAAVVARNTRRIADLNAKLFQNDAIARRDVDQSETDADQAEADRESALQQLRALGLDSGTIDTLRRNLPVASPQGAIRAPIAGTVVERLISPGQLLQAGATPCFTVADMSKVWVMGNVFTSDLASVQRGDQVDVTSNAWPEVFHGTLDYVGALVSTDTRATSVRITVPNLAGRLRKDMYVDVTIHSRQPRSGLLIPVSAVIRDADNNPLVFIDRGAGRFERRTVQLGLRVDDRYEIMAGLKAGDRVVSQGSIFLQSALSQ